MEPPRLGMAAVGGRHWMGGANYVRNLAAAVRAVQPETPLTWICGEPLLEDWRDVEPRWTVRNPTRFERLFRRQKSKLRRVLETACVNFLYPLTYDNEYNLGLSFPLSPALGSCAWAGWIPDFQHRHLPELFSAEELRRRDVNMERLAREAPRVVLSSRDALADFARFFPAYAAKGTLLTFRVDPVPPADDTEAAGEVPERFFLVCNQFWKHKNHAVVFEALRILQGRGVKPLVLCTGALNAYPESEYIEGLRRALHEGGLGEQVRLLGLVPGARIKSLLRRAIAVVQPSLFEGWSTVVEDARSFGRPSLLSDLAVHREQAPTGARYFSPHDAEALARLMAEAWRDWPSGPDPAAESAAYAQGREHQLEFGRQFLALAQGAPLM